jgi:hypothetical protein
MKKNTSPQLQNSVVLCADDWDTLEPLLRSTICDQDKDGVAVVITIHSDSAQNTIEAKLEFMD